MSTKWWYILYCMHTVYCIYLLFSDLFLSFEQLHTSTRPRSPAPTALRMEDFTSTPKLRCLTVDEVLRGAKETEDGSTISSISSGQGSLGEMLFSIQRQHKKYNHIKSNMHHCNSIKAITEISTQDMLFVFWFINTPTYKSHKKCNLIKSNIYHWDSIKKSYPQHINTHHNRLVIYACIGVL